MWCCPVRSRWHQASSEKHLSESLETTLWKSNAAMENTSFIDDSPIHTSIYRGFLIAMFDCRKVVWYFSLQVLAANPCQQMDQNGGTTCTTRVLDEHFWIFHDISSFRQHFLGSGCNMFQPLGMSVKSDPLRHSPRIASCSTWRGKGASTVRFMIRDVEHLCTGTRYFLQTPNSVKAMWRVCDISVTCFGLFWGKGI